MSRSRRGSQTSATEHLRVLAKVLVVGLVAVS